MARDDYREQVCRQGIELVPVTISGRVLFWLEAFVLRYHSSWYHQQCTCCWVQRELFGKMVKKMKPYRCEACGYIYEPVRGGPKNGIPPGTAFEDLPKTYTCPVGGNARIR